MARLKNPRTVTVVVEGEEYEKFINALPRRIGFSETVREWIKSVNEETEKEKNLNAPDYGAVRVMGVRIPDANMIRQLEHKNLSLDLFTIQRSDIPEIIQEIDRKGVLGKLMGDARVILSCSKKQIDRL